MSNYSLKLLIVCLLSRLANSEREYLQRLEPNVIPIIEQSGLSVRSHELVSADGYLLTLHQIMNPKIGHLQQAEKRLPLLFVPPTGSQSGIFLFRGLQARAKDLSQLNLTSLSLEETIKLLDEEPASQALPYLAAQLGHPVWLFERRGMEANIAPGVPAYRNKSLLLGDGVQTDHCACGDPQVGDYEAHEDIERMLDYYEQNVADQSYWSFSLDEQAEFDLPRVIEYALEVCTSDRLALVGDSSGATLIFASLIVHPSLADKVAIAVALAPVFYTYSRLPTIELQMIGRSFPFHYTALTGQFMCLQTRYHARDLGDSPDMFNALIPPNLKGMVGDEFPTDKRLLAFKSLRSSVRERIQFVQSSAKGRMHYYDFGEASANMERYGQPESPAYNLSLARLQRSVFFSGAHDGEVRLGSIQRMAMDLPANSSKHYYIDLPGVQFAHESVVQHKHLSRLVVIPALWEIQRAAR